MSVSLQWPTRKERTNNFMATQIIAGRINADGSTAAGDGFYVRASGDGAYFVEFDRRLESVPTVVVTQNYETWDGFAYGGGNTLDNAVLVAVDEKGFKVITGDNAGTKIDRNFAFIAAAAASQASVPAVVWGDLNGDKGIYSGSGFQNTRIGEGVYMIDFDTPFETLTSVVFTQNYIDWRDFGFRDGDARDNALIVAADGSQIKYITGDNTGAKVNRNCSFVAIGTGGGATAAPRFTFGNVNADGNIRDAGSGDFSINKEAAGTYTINFNNPFPHVPAIVVTQNYRDWKEFRYSSGDTRDNAVVVAVDSAHARVITGDNAGSKVDRNFAFLVVG